MSVIYKMMRSKLQRHCFDTLKKMVRSKSQQFLQPRREADRCAWFHKYKHEVVPASEQTLAECVKELKAFTPTYFSHLPSVPTSASPANPAATCRMYRMYVYRSVSEVPTPKS